MLQLQKKQAFGLSDSAKKTCLYAAFLILFVGIGIGTEFEKHRRHERLQAIVSAVTLTDVSAAFQKWKQSEIDANGNVLIWSGKESEILMIDRQDSCSKVVVGRLIAEQIEMLPCWTIWAKTPNGRYFTEKIFLDPDLKPIAHEQKTELKKADVIQDAIRQQRPDVIKLLGVSSSGA